PGGGVRLDRTHVGLATVAMAVTASSAFPGFFPPLELTGADIGADRGAFGRQSYTDGGVFDNLGVRMFRCLERPLLADSPLCREDFVDFPAAVEALRAAGGSAEESPLHRLTQVLGAVGSRPDVFLLPNGETPGRLVPVAAGGGNGEGEGEVEGDGEGAVLTGLWNVLRHY